MERRCAWMELGQEEVALCLKAHGQLLLALPWHSPAHPWLPAAPPVLPGASTPQTLPCSSQAWQEGSQQGKTPLWQHTGPAPETAGSSGCLLALGCSSDPQCPWLQNGKGDSVSLKCFRGKMLREKLATTGAAISIAGPGGGQGWVLSKVRGSQLVERACLSLAAAHGCLWELG